MGVSTSCAVSYIPTVVGPHTITASYGGDASHLGSSGAFVVTALKHETSTEVSCMPAMVPVGSPSSCTATVTDSTPTSATAPSGTVSFSQDTDSAFASCSLGSPSTNATTGAVSTSCAVTYTPSTVGIHLITASYGGDTSHLSSSGTTTVTALQRSTSTSVTCSPATIPVNASTTCTATVSDNDVGTKSTPSGTVSFTSTGVGIFSGFDSCTLDSTGKSSITYTPIEVGTGSHAITATYEGDTTHASSRGSTSVTVTKRSTTTTVSCTPSSFQANGSTTCTAVVADTASGSQSAPMGSVSVTPHGGVGPFRLFEIAPAGTTRTANCS